MCVCLRQHPAGCHASRARLSMRVEKGCVGYCSSSAWQEGKWKTRSPESCARGLRARAGASSVRLPQTPALTHREGRTLNIFLAMFSPITRAFQTHMECNLVCITKENAAIHSSYVVWRCVGGCLSRARDRGLHPAGDQLQHPPQHRRQASRLEGDQKHPREGRRVAMGERLRGCSRCFRRPCDV